MIQTIGLVAGVFTASSMVPQLIKIIREKQAENISIVMLLTLMAGVGMWIYYGILREDLPIIITNAFSLTINTITLIYKLKYK